MAIHVKELIIDSYRGIQNLKISELNHVNIFTGNNNAGKTSILEILQAFSGLDTFFSLIQMANNHPSLSMYNDILGIFPFEKDMNVLLHAVFGNGEHHDIEIIKTEQEIQIPETEYYRRLGVMRTGSVKKDQIETFTETKQLDLHVNQDDMSYTYTVLEDQRSFRREIKKPLLLPVVFIRPFSHVARNNYGIIDDLLKTVALKQDLLSILKEFDNSILDFSKVDTEYFIHSSKYEKAMPLTYYGDGMKKAILILSGVLTARGGILLIDEFETAIHCSAMEKLFSWIIKTAKKSDVQLFFTSHSKEAIDKLVNLPECNEDIAHYTLYKKDDNSLVRRLSGKDVLRLEQNGMEIR